MQATPSLRLMRDALLPLVGQAGYRRLLSAIYDPVLLRAANAPDETIQALSAFCRTNDIESVPRQEQVLDSDSKSRIYVVHTEFEGQVSWPLVLKCYKGTRQQTAPIEARMSVYFKQCLAPQRTVVPILNVVSLTEAGDQSLSVALLPYAGGETLYDRLHQLPPHTTKVEDLVQQACETLAYTQVIGRAGYEARELDLTSLSPKTASGYFQKQIQNALIVPFATAGTPLDMGDDLLKQFGVFANLLGEDSSAAGLYYRGINPRNVMLMDAAQAEIDFEQNSLRSRFIDIVSLLENGIEMTEWDDTVDYRAYSEQTDFHTWHQQRQRALVALDQFNYLSLRQIELLAQTFIDTTCDLEQQYRLSTPAFYDPARYRLLLETARLFRHLQYISACFPVSGVYDLTGPIPQDRLQAFIPEGTDPLIASPLNYTTDNRIPFLLAVGEHDFPVLYEQAHTMDAALRQAKGPVEFLEIAGADHFRISQHGGDPSQIWVQRARAWMQDNATSG